MASLREATLAGSAARTASGNGSTFGGFAQASRLAAQLKVTAKAGTNPTLDVKVQHSIDGGSTWFDLLTFTQATDATTELLTYAEVADTTAQVIGDELRATWAIGGTDPSFTFSVTVAGEGDSY